MCSWMRRLNRQHRVFLEQWNYSVLLWSRPTNCTKLRMSPNVNYGLSCVNVGSSIITNIKFWVWYADIRGDFAYMGTVSIWETSAPPTQFYCERKTALQNSLFKKKQRRYRSIQNHWKEENRNETVKLYAKLINVL